MELADMAWYPYIMCSKCQDILPGFGIPHDTTRCPLKHYCAICASYVTHTTDNCPDTEVLKRRHVEFVEQLIPHSLLEHYGIKTLTPITNSPSLKKPLYDPEWRVEDCDKTIRQIIRNVGKEPSQKSKVNRRMLEQIADDRKLKLVYIKPKVDEAPEQNPPPKATTKTTKSSSAKNKTHA